MDVQTLCRGCMKEVTSWERGNFDSRVVEMFSFCTNLRITMEDGLPQQFCYDCVIKIESSYTFITEAQKVHVTLKNTISRTNTTVIIEPETYKTHSEIKLTLPDYKICSVIEDTRVPLKTAESTDNYVDNDISEQSMVNEQQTVVNERLNVDNGPLRGDSEPEVAKDKNVCLVCRKSFTSKTWFAKHMEKEHTRKYVCEHCPKSFSRPSQLTSHAVSHSDVRQFACNACGKRFKRRKQLAVHTRAHSDARPFACDQCPARFKTKSTLKGHVAVHDQVKSFLCSYCGWRFAQAGNLRVHMRGHTGERPPRPPHPHPRTHPHAPAPRRPCARCGKTFSDTSNLARHIRTHTGALPYKCPNCPSAFSDSWKRKAHLMRAHKVPLHDIPRMKPDGRLVQ